MKGIKDLLELDRYSEIAQSSYAKGRFRGQYGLSEKMSAQVKATATQDSEWERK